MEYIIKCESYRLLKDKINELTKDIDKENITYFDMTIDSIENILEECNYNSLFNIKKAIIVYNTTIFNTKYEYKDILEKVEKYLNNPNINTILIFVADSISLRKKCVKIIKEKNNLFEIETPVDKELENYIRKYLENNNFKIENNALKKIINNLNNNYDFILNELDKIMIVKTDNLINVNDIDCYTTKLEENNIFDFVDSVIKKDNKKMFDYLKTYVKNKEEPSILFASIASQYRLIYCVKNLHKNGQSEKEIADNLKIHPYRVKLALENSYNYTNQELEEKLLYIGKLDEKIKLGIIENYKALKLFLISI